MKNSKQKQEIVALRVRGASQNNLRNLDIDIPLNHMTVVTGVSGSGKSSLAFDTVYAEGQRRYVETFSPYARQFLDRMDRPRVEKIEGVPPAVAIDQVNPVRTTRSTVGTMTELNDHLKLFFARAASLYCSSCGDHIKKNTSEEIADLILKQYKSSEPQTKMVQILFSIVVPKNISTDYAEEYLERQGYKRIAERKGDTVIVVQDRLAPTTENRSRLVEAVEVALKRSNGKVFTQKLGRNRKGVGRRIAYSDKLHCAKCDKSYSEPLPNLFSFNSPIGACEACRGFGQLIGIDYSLVIPDESLSIREGVIKPFTSKVYGESWDDLLKHAPEKGVPVDVPWNQMKQEDKDWVMEGEAGLYSGRWYGVRRFFNWLENRKHKMHVRVYLSYYRAYTECPDCCGSRLKPEAFLWRIGQNKNFLKSSERFRHPAFTLSDKQFNSLPGLTVQDVVRIPIKDCAKFFANIKLPVPVDEATDLVLTEIRARLGYLVDVGLGYLNLDRQSKTLSGGEVQRINLTTALGTTLVNTLFVLDEPTIGLHARDVGRVIGILHRLRQAGNTLLVVEHEEQMIRAADRILDMGPGPGERGGTVVHFGTFGNLLNSDDSITGACLKNGDYLPDSPLEKVWKNYPRLTVRGAQQNNLKRIDASVPLNRLVCVTGVSGSGKSTLVEETLYRGICRAKGVSIQTPGIHQSIEGVEMLSSAVMVSQSPIGRTARSNPVSYVGALTAIREKFAKEPLAISRGYTAGYFSFNSDLGRCPTCAGSGFEHVEMQFLSDVYLRCPDCDGTRFKAEIGDVKVRPSISRKGSAHQPKSIVEILDMTVAEAADFFYDNEKIIRGLRPLIDVGLEYLKLGQPVPTLSGGEAQRLKLAAHIAKSGSGGSKKSEKILFLFDEPTTGLHFVDVSKLINSLRKLLANGHSVVVIEHNLDLISCSDWIVDLGPEGGDAGGRLIAEGTPKDVAKVKSSHTGNSLREYFRQMSKGNGEAYVPQLTEGKRNTEIAVKNAREHNLKNISLSVPYNAITVITGISGSGKSTIAFDILFTEGQKRYLETLNAYARQFVQPAKRADFDAVTGLPPTVAIEQRTSRGGRKSTVATLTEVYHFIRLLFVRLGTQYCPDCNVKVNEQSVAAVIEQIWSRHENKRLLVMSPLVVARKGFYTDLATWAHKKNVPYLYVDGERVPTGNWPRLDRYKEHDIDMPVWELGLRRAELENLREAIRVALEHSQGHFKIAILKHDDFETVEKVESYSTTRSCPRCSRSFRELDPRLFSYNSRHGWCDTCVGTGLYGSTSEFDEGEDEAAISEACPDCNGKRLCPEALAVRFKNRAIDQINEFSIRDAHKFFAELKLTEREETVAIDVLSELNSRLEFLESVGLSYLSLDRSAPTLSGGEAQRIRLAAQLGSSLCGACYILDEPTIGLHNRDNKRLLEALRTLREKGNTIVVVEHDEDTIECADNIVDLGPGGGVRGGEVVATGTLDDIRKNPNSVTGKSLREPLMHPQPRKRGAPDPKQSIQVTGAARFNLKKVKATIPAKALVCVTGVSGSGKSTLVRDVLHRNFVELLSRSRNKETSIEFYGCERIEGWEMFNRVLEVDQTPIGKTPRSCPATYLNLWQKIRALFAETPEAKLRGYEPGRFSFNVEGGRCSICEGQGEKKIEMNFLPNVRVNCEACNGARFNAETLTVTYRDKSIADVLAMSMEEATEFFKPLASIRRVLELLVEVGLGYLTLGQPSPTLSGGEAQRIKLVSELSKAKSTSARRIQDENRVLPQTLYILDEPTVGLHAADIEKLIHVIHALVDAGNTVVVVEHNLDIVAEADWIIDLGPEGGDSGGKIVAQGTLKRILRSKHSHTAEAMREFFGKRVRSAETDQLSTDRAFTCLKSAKD